jgi:hypothetical protein
MRNGGDPFVPAQTPGALEGDDRARRGAADSPGGRDDERDPGFHLYAPHSQARTPPKPAAYASRSRAASFSAGRVENRAVMLPVAVPLSPIIGDIDHRVKTRDPNRSIGFLELSGSLDKAQPYSGNNCLFDRGRDRLRILLGNRPRNPRAIGSRNALLMRWAPEARLEGRQHPIPTLRLPGGQSRRLVYA